MAREEKLRIYSRIPVQSIGKLVQSSNSCLAASSVPFHQLLGTCWPVPGLSNLSCFFSTRHLPPPAAVMAPSHSAGTRGSVPASQPCCFHHPLALTFLSHFTSLKEVSS